MKVGAWRLLAQEIKRSSVRNTVVCSIHGKILRCAQDDSEAFCHPELPFTSHKRGIDETWRSEFQTAAKDLAAHEARPFAALRVTGIISQCLRNGRASQKLRPCRGRASA